MLIEEYLANIPLLHTWDGGKTWSSGGFNDAQLKLMITLIRKTFSAPRIIETGAGNSTISFLFCNPSEVVSICPEEIVFDRINNFCVTHSVSTQRLQRIIGCSERELPQIAQRVMVSGKTFDFALIDGHHGWPNVFVDFCYVNALTGQGSLIMVDDIQLHSVRELANLLLEQPGFSFEEDFGKALVFRKTTSAPSMPEWISQPYIVRRSMPPLPSRLRQFLSPRIRTIIMKLPLGPSLIRGVKRKLNL